MRAIPRIIKKTSIFGEDFKVNGTTDAKGFFQLLDSGRMRTYFDDTEALAIAKPSLILITPAETSLAVGNTIARDGKTYTVRKIVIERFAGEDAVKIAALTQ